ncbi:MAG: hypothetical protein JNL17_07690 [Cyclobacteriaceae bacterium]|nr:hypothetical protein [Cyclobacteriaceae bacterium]
MSLVVVLALTSRVSAQDAETVFGKGGPKVRGAYGAAVEKFSSIDGQFAHFIGGYGGVLFTNHLMIGAGAYALINGNSIDIESDPNTSRQLTYLGLAVERTFNSQKAFHLTASLLTGGAIIGEQNRLPDGGQYSIRSRGSFALEPGLAAEVNLTKWFRVAGGVSYRWVASESKYSAPAGSITLKFGKF